MSRLEVPRGGGPGSKLGGRAAGSGACGVGAAGGGACGVGDAAGARWAPTRRLFHAAAQHLVGRDEHDTDDEGDGKGADQALAHARLADLLVGTGCSRPPGTPGKETKGDNERMESDLHLGKRT